MCETKIQTCITNYNNNKSLLSCTTRRLRFKYMTPYYHYNIRYIIIIIFFPHSIWTNALIDNDINTIYNLILYYNM